MLKIKTPSLSTNCLSVYVLQHKQYLVLGKHRSLSVQGSLEDITATRQEKGGAGAVALSLPPCLSWKAGPWPGFTIFQFLLV